MEIGVAVRLADLRRVDVRQPVVGDHLAGDVEDQPAERVTLVGVGLDAPVSAIDVFVDRGFDVDQGPSVVAQPAMLVAIGDVGAKGAQVIGLDQHLLDDVLHLFDRRVGGGEAVPKHLQYTLGEVVYPVVVEFAAGLPGARECGGDTADLEDDARAVALDDAGRKIQLAGLQYGTGLGFHRFAPPERGAERVDATPDVRTPTRGTGRNPDPCGGTAAGMRMMKPLVRDAPPLLREKDAEAGLLALGSSRFARLPGVSPVARWGKDSPITVAGAAPDFECDAAALGTGFPINPVLGEPSTGGSLLR